jgi:hypothetical protein
MAIAIQSYPAGSQNNDDPHRAQKPRFTFSEDLNQVTFSCPLTTSDARGTFPEAK